jgi:NDP-sugar pyrophosphorylase family protein
MDAFAAAEFFDLDGFAHAALFAADRPVWEALGGPLDALFAGFAGWQDAPPLPPGVHHLGGPLAIAAGCTIEPGAVLRGPLIVGAGCQIRTGAYVRGGVVLGDRCIVGAHTEVKRAVFLDGARAPHQNYVGDSILGRDVNLGAGTILSNVKNVGHEVTFQHRGEAVHTGLRKLGAILGDGCRTGCNTVLNPGVLMGRGCVTYPNVVLRSGLYPAGTLVKLRQEQRQIVLARLASD